MTTFHKFEVGDTAVIVAGCTADADDEDLDGAENYHYLRRNTVVTIESADGTADSVWGDHVVIRPVPGQENIWVDDEDMATQHVHAIHLAPNLQIDTSNIQEVEAWLASP